MTLRLYGSADASLSDDHTSAGIAGRIIAFLPGSTVEEELLRFVAHLRVSDIHQAEWYATLLCAHYLNALFVRSFIESVERERRSTVNVVTVVYTDREASIRRAEADSAWQFYAWNIERMYDSELIVEHINRRNDAHRLVNLLARRARNLHFDDGLTDLTVICLLSYQDDDPHDPTMRRSLFELIRDEWRSLRRNPLRLPRPPRRDRPVWELLQ